MVPKTNALSIRPQGQLAIAWAVLLARLRRQRMKLHGASLHAQHCIVEWRGFRKKHIRCVRAESIFSLINNISPHWGLNPGPSVYKTDALPLSYRGICLCGGIKCRWHISLEPFQKISQWIDWRECSKHLLVRRTDAGGSAPAPCGWHCNPFCSRCVSNSAADGIPSDEIISDEMRP